MIAWRGIGTILAFGLAASVLSSPFNYAQRSVRVRAAVVIIDSQQISGYPANYTPFVWLNIDSNKNVKPAGWTFYNPSPPTQITPEIAARWTAINTANGSAIVPTIGLGLTKRDAPYWEVFLSQVTDEQLSQFDALLLPIQGKAQLNPLEREKLRRFMEHGGVLWVDVSGTGTVDLINGLPLPFSLNMLGAPAPINANYSHPLLDFPGNINAVSLLAMQSDTVYGLTNVDLTGFADLQDTQQTTAFEYSRLMPVAADGRGPILSVGRVGDGYEVVTTRGVATTLNRTLRLVSGEPMPGAYQANNVSVAENPLFDRTADAAARLVANMVHLTSGFEQTGKGARKTRGSNIDLGAPLLKRFNAPIAFGPDYFIPPAVFKGLAVVATPTEIYVYDANPARDLDGDGNPDDGEVDLALGNNYDLIWHSEIMPGPISAPTCAEVAGSLVPDQIAVIDGVGNLHIFNAFPTVASPVPATFNAIVPPGYSPPSGGFRPFAPTFYDNMYFVADEATDVSTGVVGRVWVAEAETGQVITETAPWAVGGAGVAIMQRPSGSPTIGAIPIRDNSGGVDRVVYVPMLPNTGASTGGTAGIASLWFGAKGEKPTAVNQFGNQLQVVTRAAMQGLQVYFQAGVASSLGLKLTVLDDTGVPLDAAAMDAMFAGTPPLQSAGVLTFTLEPAVTFPSTYSVRIDYTINWGTGQPANQATILRGLVTFPDDANHLRIILNPLALSPEGTLHVVTANPDTSTTIPPNGFDGGTYWALREEARGTFKLLNRFDLYQVHDITLSQAPTVKYSETILDTDELQTFMPAFLGGSFTRLRYRGGPAVQGGLAYINASGYKAGGLVPCNIVMAFEAEPDEPSISVPDIGGSFAIVQPDMARSDNKITPNIFSSLQQNQFKYEPGIPGGRGIIRFPSLSPNPRGSLLNSISRSQPIIIRRSGQPDLFIEPDRLGSKWSSLQWYAAFHGYDNRSPILATGNTIFFAAKSMLPDIVSGVPFGLWKTRGLLVGMDATISPNDAFVHSNPIRPWLKQVWQIDVDFPAPGNIAPNPAIRWPQMRGVTSFDEWRQRLLQTTLGPSNDSFGISGGDGVLLSWSEMGLWAYSRADFIVADEGRLVRFDSSGNPVWTSSSSTGTGTETDSGGAGNVRPLVRPTRAYPLNAREMLIVDTAGDRLSVMDVSGRELRSIGRFRLDQPAVPGGQHYIPEGFVTNGPLTLNKPRDVYVYGTYVNNPPYSNAMALEYWVHYLIADSGNRRLIEVIDRYAADPVTRRILDVIVDGTGEKALGILNWHSPASLSGKNFQYSGIAAVYDAITPPGNRIYAASIGSALPTRTGIGLDTPTPVTPVESEEGNGGIVLFDERGIFDEVINEVQVPGVGPNVYYNPATGLFDMPAEGPRMKKLGNIRSVTMRFVLEGSPVQVPTLAIMFTDSEGVWEVIKPTPASPWTVRWALPKRAYAYMRRFVAGPFANQPTNGNPLDFMPTYARRLDSGEVLLANGYVGKTLPTPTGPSFEFFGEVIQVIGEIEPVNPGFDWNKQNLGFSSLSIMLQLPPVSGTRDVVMPVFADRR